MIDEIPNTAAQVRKAVHHPHNQQKVNDLVVKMGRLLAKKRALSSQRPQKILMDRVWVGNYLYATDSQFLLQNNIKTVISCLQLSLSHYLPDIVYRQLVLKDNEDPTFQRVIDEFYDLVANSKGNVFVHCFSGVSRSVALIISYMMKSEGVRYQTALSSLKQSYPIGNPNSYFASIMQKNEEKWIKEKERQSENFDLLNQDQPISEPSTAIVIGGESRIQQSPFRVQRNSFESNNIQGVISQQQSEENKKSLSPSHSESINLLGHQQVVEQKEKQSNQMRSYFEDTASHSISSDLKEKSQESQSAIAQSQKLKQQSQGRIQGEDLLGFIEEKIQEGKENHISQAIPIVPVQNLIISQAPVIQQSHDLLQFHEPSKEISPSNEQLSTKDQLIKVQQLQTEVIANEAKVEIKGQAAKEEELIESADFTQKKRKPKKKKK